MARPEAEYPIFGKYQDFLAWLLPLIAKFPRDQRFVLGNRLADAAFGGHSLLIRARKVTGRDRIDTLLQADVAVEDLRLMLRLALELKCMSLGQYEHGARFLTEIGRMLGGWRSRSTP